MSKSDAEEWYIEFQKSDARYPFNSKLRKVVWRGSLVDVDDSAIYESIQWKLSKSLHEHNFDFVDAGIDEIPNHLNSMDLTPIGGIKAKFESRTHMQKYMAIIDVGGSSKNDTFAPTLCMNSVTILIDSNIVPFYHYDAIPWKHYIPVKSDLSDLIENIVFALNPKNELIIKDLILSANQFCADRFILDQLSHDLVDTWERYIHLLDTYDISWKSKWQTKKDTILRSRLYNLDQVI
jgi:Glycosyl transferase family 90